MKTFKKLAFTILILMIGTFGLLFEGYKILLDRPGFFRQFDNEIEVRAFLVDNLAINEESKDFAIEYISQHLSRNERCSDLMDATIPIRNCLTVGCPSVTDETQYTVIHCRVLSNDVFINYLISLYFEYDVLIDIEVEPRSGLP